MPLSLEEARAKFLDELSRASKDGGNHFFHVPRRIGATTTLSDMDRRGEGHYEPGERGVSAERIELNSGCRVCVAVPSDSVPDIIHFYEGEMTHHYITVM